MTTNNTARPTETAERPRDEQDEALRAVLEASLAKLTPKNRKPAGERKRRSTTTSKPTPKKVKTSRPLRTADPVPYREVPVHIRGEVDWMRVRSVTVLAIGGAGGVTWAAGAYFSTGALGAWAWPVSAVVVTVCTVWALIGELRQLLRTDVTVVTERVIDTEKVCYGSRGGAYTYRSDGTKKRIKRGTVDGT